MALTKIMTAMASLSDLSSIDQVPAVPDELDFINTNTLKQVYDAPLNSTESMYAGHSSHRSHSSHSSHSSHYSGSSGGGYYSAPSYTPSYSTPSYSSPSTSNNDTDASSSNDSKAKSQIQILYDKDGSPYVCKPAKGTMLSCKPLASSLKSSDRKTREMATLVMRVQIALIVRGIYRGELTGELQQETRDAIRVFQRAESISSEYFLDKETLSSLGVSIVA